MEYKTNWLPHLKESLPNEACGLKLCTYTISLEGWRRGLTLKYYLNEKSKIRYSLSSATKTHEFYYSRGDLVSDEAFAICRDKSITKEVLSKSGISVPEGKRFPQEAADEEIITYAHTLGFPLVVKPTNGDMGIGVVPNIQSEDELKKALQYVRYELKFPDVIVEQYIAGKEYRVYVVNNEVVSAIHRIPANVTGDGISTIKQLIEKKNFERKQNPRLMSCLIKMKQEMIDFLHRKGYTLETVPPKGETVFLTEKSNVSAGGDPIDAFEQLPDAVKKLSVSALRALPNMAHGGIDVIIDEQKQSGFIIELSGRTQIGGVLFPEEGSARDIPKAIIDYYFPETKKEPEHKGNYYFDFGKITDPLRSGFATEVTVPPIPEGEQVSKKWIITGTRLGPRYFRWVHKKAIALKINGFAKKALNGEVSAVVSGTTESIERFKELIWQGAPGVAEVTNVEESEWNQSIKIGFEIIEIPEEKLLTKKLEEKDKQIKKLKSEKKKLKSDMKQLEKEFKAVEKKYLEIQQSRIWKLSSPVRSMMSYIKKRSN